MGVSGASLASAGAITNNTILPDGTINGLNLEAGSTLTIRNYAGNFPVTVLGQAAFDPAATLQIVLDGNPWGSTISFASGIPVTLAGEMDLEIASGVNLASLVGDTFQLFNWTGVSPTGQFDIVADPGWDVSQLYTTGQVTYVGTVPEPSTFALLAAGAVGFLAYALRRHKKAS
jgi:hypothetical protein